MIERSVAAASKAARICWGVGAVTLTTDPNAGTRELGGQMDDHEENHEGGKSDFNGPHFDPPRLPSLGARNFA